VINVPFASEKQKKWMFVHIPKVAVKWAKEEKKRGRKK
jgi:hypothetical protein